MAETEVCKKCGRIFTYSGYGGMYCSDCRQADFETFDLIRNYIREHGEANMYELSLHTGVSEKEIRRYLRESRLEIPDDSNVFIKCERCHCDIRSGRYCPTCASELSKNLKGIMNEVGEKPKKESGKMRFIKADDSRRR